MEEKMQHHPPFAKGISLALFCILLADCGGASVNGGSGDIADKAGASAQANSPEETQKVAEARNRCQKEIEKSELQPPDHLAPIQIHACIYSKRSDVGGCYAGPTRTITLKIIVEKDGKVSNVFPVGDHADNPEAKCVADIVQSIGFPKFKGQTQQVIKYPFNLGQE